MKVELSSRYEVGDETIEDNSGIEVKGKVIKVAWYEKDFHYLIEYKNEERKWVSEKTLENSFC